MGRVNGAIYSVAFFAGVLGLFQVISARQADERLRICGYSRSELFASRLYTAEIPDPDLLIRTSGELRVSNFLLWQISYAEIVIFKKYWPDFKQADLQDAVGEYARRHRRFGGL